MTSIKFYIFASFLKLKFLPSFLFYTKNVIIST